MSYSEIYANPNLKVIAIKNTMCIIISSRANVLIVVLHILGFSSGSYRQKASNLTTILSALFLIPLSGKSVGLSFPGTLFTNLIICLAYPKKNFFNQHIFSYTEGFVCFLRY